MLPWYTNIIKQRRCRAHMAPNDSGLWGRCELARHGSDIEHALERGMEWVRWADGPVRYETPHYDEEN